MKDPQTLITCFDRDVPNRETAQLLSGALALRRFRADAESQEINKHLNLSSSVLRTTLQAPVVTTTLFYCVR